MAKQSTDPNAPKDYTSYATAKPTPLQVDFTGWITDKTGYDPASAKSKAEAFAEGVRLGVALRIPFQASDENKEATAARKAARAAETSEPKAEASSETAPAKAAKATKAAAKPATATPEAAPPAAESAPASPRRRGARKSTATSAAAF